MGNCRGFNCRTREIVTSLALRRLLICYLLILPAQGISDELCSGDTGDISNMLFDFGILETCTVNHSITVGPDVFVDSGSGLALYTLTASVSELDILSGATFIVSIANPANLLLLNDTGITTCSNNSFNNQACPVSLFPGQDAEFGRDVTGDNADGHAGFSFTKIDTDGLPLAANALTWFCVKDNLTGLIWENKTDDGGLQDKDNTYSWFDNNGSINGGDEGEQNLGICTGSECDTQDYVNVVNNQGICGAKDWRMPQIKELENLASLDRFMPAIDTAYFPNTKEMQQENYWSATPDAEFSVRAWYLHSYNGLPKSNIEKAATHYVRLVRDGQ